MKLVIKMGSDKKIKAIKGEIPLIFIKEKNQIVAFSPALDLSTCGKTFQKAKIRFHEAVTIFWEELIKMGTLEDVLKENGWQKIKSEKNKPTWQPPAIVGNIEENFNVAAVSF